MVVTRRRGPRKIQSCLGFCTTLLFKQNRWFVTKHTTRTTMMFCHLRRANFVSSSTALSSSTAHYQKLTRNSGIANICRRNAAQKLNTTGHFMLTSSRAQATRTTTTATTRTTNQHRFGQYYYSLSTIKNPRLLRSCPLLVHKNHQALVVNLGSLSYFSSSSGGNRRPPGNSRWTQGASLLGTGALVLWGKGKYLLAALKLTKLASLGSMVFTIGTYSMFFGLPYAVGMVGLITVHEAGHALVMLQRGISFSPMVFVPFMGAFIEMNRTPRDAWEDSMVAMGGPVLGSLAAAGCAVGGHATDSQLLLALADFGFMINLFNLLPIGSMDGGRVANALSPYAGVAGLGLGGMIAYSGVIHNPIFYLILMAGGWSTFQRFYDPTGSVPPNYYKITTGQRVALAGGYIGLIGALIAATSINNQMRKPPEVLEREQKEKSWNYM